MVDNSQQLLNDVLAQQRQDRAHDLSDQDYFELFSAEQILKDFNLSYEELQAGIVDGEHDGGIDSAFAFVNGELVYEDFDCSPFKKDVRIELHIIQSKTSGGFSESPINRLISSSQHLLLLQADFDDLPQYSDAVKSVLNNFRQTYRALASTFPSLHLFYYYASKSATAEIHQNLRLKANELESIASDLFPDAEVSFQFLGARSLLDMARKRPKTTYDLRVNKTLNDVDSYVVLSPLGEYVDFLKDAEGNIRGELFESNVRDFQGATEVNADIVKTLKDEEVVDFWWMNNGVTILASRATHNGDIVTIENPQIVNGLQTSTQIAAHFEPSEKDNRSVMVKIVSSEDEETRDKIIKATNSQNGIQPATLRATDKIQRDIEEALKSTGLFYDSRKNYYKNEGKSADKIISIALMAQAVMTILLGRPDSARARPSSLIKKDEDYSKVFSEGYPVEVYTKAAALMRRVGLVLKSRSEMTSRDRSNMRFYVLFWISRVLVQSMEPRAAQVARIDLKGLDDGDIEAATDEVWKLYEELGRSDQVAKGPDLRKAVVNSLQEELKKKRRGGGKPLGQVMISPTGEWGYYKSSVLGSAFSPLTSSTHRSSSFAGLLTSVLTGWAVMAAAG